MGMVERRLESGSVPLIYRNATLDSAPSEIALWAASYEPGVTRKGLLLSGGFGTGKTYAACACLRKAAELKPVTFTTMAAALDRLRPGQRGLEGGAADYLARLRGCSLLCIDDLGKEKATDWAGQHIYEIIDSRVANGRPTIYTTNYSRQGLVERFARYMDAETAGAIVSRISGSTVPVRMGGADRRLTDVR